MNVNAEKNSRQISLLLKLLNDLQAIKLDLTLGDVMGMLGVLGEVRETLGDVRES